MDGDIFEEFQKMEEEMRRMMRRLGMQPGHAFGIDEPGMARRYLPERAEETIDLPVKRKDMSEFRQINESRIPKSHITETETKVIAAFELPGVDKKDIELNVTNDFIEVKTHTKQQRRQEDKEKGTYSYEVSSMNFYRRLPVPINVEADKAQAEYKDGMLRIEIPKKEISRQKRVDIK